MQKEAKARIKINNLLQSSGWRFFDDEKGTANIALENNVKLTKNAVDELGNDFDKTKDGFVDFLLLDEKDFPYVVLEAKSEDKDPLNGKEQARRYAQSQNVYISISTNGHFVNENNVDMVVENTPDKLIFSVDGLDEESYQKYRVGGTFEQADKGLRLLIKALRTPQS